MAMTAAAFAAIFCTMSMPVWPATVTKMPPCARGMDPSTTST